MKRFTSLEQRIDAAAHVVLDRMPRSGVSGALVEFLVFGLKQGWACLYGGLLLALIVGTRWFWPDGWWLTRYDFLFLAALSIQLVMLAARLEKPAEALVILIFHLVGTAMNSSRPMSAPGAIRRRTSFASVACRSFPASCMPRWVPTLPASRASSTCATRTTRRYGRRSRSRCRPET